MINFVEKLQKEIRFKIEQIEAEDKNILKKSLDASRVLGTAFDRLKEFIITYRFKDEDEEIDRISVADSIKIITDSFNAERGKQMTSLEKLINIFTENIEKAKSAHKQNRFSGQENLFCLCITTNKLSQSFAGYNINIIFANR